MEVHMKRCLHGIGYLLSLSVSMLAWFFTFVGCVVCMPSGYGLELKIIPLGVVMITSFFFFVYQVSIAYDCFKNVLRGTERWNKNAVDWNPLSLYLYKLPRAIWEYGKKCIANETAFLTKV